MQRRTAKQKVTNRLHSRDGVSRFLVLFTIAAVVLALLAIIPGWNAYQKRQERYQCKLALAEAWASMSPEGETLAEEAVPPEAYAEDAEGEVPEGEASGEGAEPDSGETAPEGTDGSGGEETAVEPVSTEGGSAWDPVSAPEAVEKPGDALQMEAIYGPWGKVYAVTGGVSSSGSPCPHGGDCYLLPQMDSGVLICALHDTNEARRVSLNAGKALTLLRLALKEAVANPAGATEEADGTAEGDLSFLLNGETVTAHQVAEAPEAVVKGSIVYIPDGDEVYWFRYAGDGHNAVWDWTYGWEMFP